VHQLIARTAPPAGFPLTDKLLSSSYAVLSGHDAGAVDWKALQGIDTLVILMGGASLPGASVCTAVLRSCCGCAVDAAAGTTGVSRRSRYMALE
jgi:siroheme synthase